MKSFKFKDNHHWLKAGLVIIIVICWFLFIGALLINPSLAGTSISFILIQLFLLSYLIQIVDASKVFYLPIALLVGYFTMAYTGKFLLILCLEDTAVLLAARGVTYSVMLTPDLITETAALLMEASLVILLFYKVLQRFGAKSDSLTSNILINPCRVYWLSAGFCFLYLLLLALTLQFNIASMGKVQAALPYKFVGILYYARRYVVFAFVLFLQYLAYKDSRYIWPAILLTIFYIASEFILSTSKAVLFSGVISTGLLFYLTRKIRLPAFCGFILVFAGLILIYPFFKVFRSFELVQALFEGNLTMKLLGQAYHNSYFGGTNTFLLASLKLFSRLTGVDMLMIILDHGTTSNGENPYLYISREVMGLSLSEAHRDAPGFLGYFYLIGRAPYMLGGLFGSLCISFSYYRLLLYLKPQPVSVTLFCLFFLMAFMDGALDRNTVNVLVMTGVAAVLGSALLWFVTRQNLTDTSMED
jgi:hypothetical protein